MCAFASSGRALHTRPHERAASGQWSFFSSYSAWRTYVPLSSSSACACASPDFFRSSASSGVSPRATRNALAADTASPVARAAAPLAAYFRASAALAAASRSSYRRRKAPMASAVEGGAGGADVDGGALDADAGARPPSSRRAKASLRAATATFGGGALAVGGAAVAMLGERLDGATLPPAP